MPSYEATILADTPVAYWRLDDLTGSTVAPDISGNNFDGSYYADAIFGVASPIETDPASTAISNRVASVPALDSGTLGTGLWDAVTWEGWMYWPVGGLLADTGTLLCRNAQWGVLGGFEELTTSISPIEGKWHYLVVTRNTNVVRIYVDSVLAAQRTNVPITSMFRSIVGIDNNHFKWAGAFAPHTADASWLLGVSGGGNVWAAGGIDEPALYNYALTALQVRTHYEAAINRLLSRATIQVRVQVLLDTDSPEPVNFPFAHNWTEPISGSERVITEHLSWHTHSNRSEPDYEQRVNARPHGPRRSLEYAITPTTALSKAMFQRALWQPAQQFRLPIWTDWTPLTATANATDTTLDCDTTLRDFEVGSYCCIFTDSYNPATFQWFRITSRTDSQLGVSPAVASTVSNGVVAPVRLACLPNEESSLESYVIDKETGTLNFGILDTQLSARRVTTYVPASTYQPNLSKPAIEVFSLDSARFDILEQSQYAIHQRQLGTSLLTGNDYHRGLDTATSSTIPVRVLIVSRETLSEFYGWLAARQGRQNPVWVPSRENDLTLVAKVSSTVLRIEAGYLFYNLHYGRRDIQITYSDGTVANRRISAVVDNGNGTEDITVASLPSGTITKLSWLRFCTAPDSFELRFHRDLTTTGNMIVECAWEFNEILTTP